MLYFAYVVIFLGQTGENNQGAIVLLAMTIQTPRKKENIQKHVGGFNSAHNKAWNNFEALKNQDHHIQSAFAKKTKKSRSEYRTRLNVSVDCV